MNHSLNDKALKLLINLIEIPSFSKEEDKTADLLEHFLRSEGVETVRENNNVWAFNKDFDEAKPCILLNSHHDTVRPNKGYTRDPHAAEIIDDKLYGLGSNDAGGALVGLIFTFLNFYQRIEMKYNLILLASAEEENSGELGIRSVVPKLPEIDFAIVGEPTQMNLAIAEKGLLVLDCYARGTAGHAAHVREDYAIYKAMKAIKWFETFKFEKISETLHDTKMTVTQIEAGNQHNVVPSVCHFVVDIRVNDHYSNPEVVEIVKKSVDVEVVPRSVRLNSSSIPREHPIVRAGERLGRVLYGSPTLSDQSNLTCPSLKLGPGDSLRSHTADEYLLVSELREGIDLYIKLLDEIL